MEIRKLSQLYDYVKEKPTKRIVVAFGQDPNTIGAISKAVDLKIVNATLVGDREKILDLCQKNEIDASKFEIVHEPDEMQSGISSVKLVHEGKAQIIMKGLIGTDKYMKAILNKDFGLLPPKRVLSHVSVIEAPSYHKLLIVGDVAVIPAPDLHQKTVICQYLIHAARSLGVEKPKLAVVSATEKTNIKMPSCVDGAILSKMAERGQIKNAIIEGPLALDVAIDKESAEIKGIFNEVAGDADCLLFPSIEAGNIFYKTITKLMKAELGAFVAGAKVPAILPSRGDSESCKLNSIVLAASIN